MKNQTCVDQAPPLGPVISAPLPYPFSPPPPHPSTLFLWSRLKKGVGDFCRLTQTQREKQMTTKTIHTLCMLWLSNENSNACTHFLPQGCEA